MRMRNLKAVALMLTGAFAAASLAGCGSTDTAETAASDAATEAAAAEETTAEETTAEEEAPATDGADLSGSISLAGSTSMEKLCESMMEGFMEAYPNITVTTEYTGSGAGIESLTAGQVDIGDASRKLHDDEAANGIVENVVAIDGIAVIVDKDNTVNDISTEDLAKIYTGEITNWKDLGGADEAIVVIGRESGSGTRDAFEELVDVADKCAYAQELDSTGGVLAKVAATPGSIGYISLDALDDTVIGVKLNGAEPTEENILSGSYTLQRPFVMATKGAIADQNDLVKTWFAYVQSDEGQEIIKGAGLIVPQN